VPAVVKDIPVGLLHRMGYQFVANNPPVDKKVLQICLAAGKSRQTYPTPQFELGNIGFDINRLFHKGGATDRSDPPLHLGLVFAGF